MSTTELVRMYGTPAQTLKRMPFRSPSVQLRDDSLHCGDGVPFGYGRLDKSRGLLPQQACSLAELVLTSRLLWD